MSFDFTKMVPEIKVQMFVSFRGHVFLVFFSGKLGEVGRVWGKFGQKWCLKCIDLKKSAQNEMKCSQNEMKCMSSLLLQHCVLLHHRA